MGRTTARILVASLFMAVLSSGQEQALERVKIESMRLRAATQPQEARNQAASFHTAIRDWIESLLPKSREALHASFPFLNTALKADLERAALFDSDAGYEGKPGYATRIEL